jgi:hypothetical protein
MAAGSILMVDFNQTPEMIDNDIIHIFVYDNEVLKGLSFHKTRFLDQKVDVYDTESMQNSDDTSSTQSIISSIGDEILKSAYALRVNAGNVYLTSMQNNSEDVIGHFNFDEEGADTVLWKLSLNLLPGDPTRVDERNENLRKLNEYICEYVNTTSN